MCLHPLAFFVIALADYSTEDCMQNELNELCLSFFPNFYSEIIFSYSKISSDVVFSFSNSTVLIYVLKSACDRERIYVILSV